MAKPVLTLDITPKGRKHLFQKKKGSPCCRTHMVICPGYGDENFKFPTVEEAVIRSLARMEKKYSKEDEEDEKEEGSIVLGFTPGLLIEGGASPAAVLAPLPDVLETGVDATLFAAAEGIRLKIEDGKYDAIVAERFDDHVDKVTWAKEHLANDQVDLRPAILSLEHQLSQLRHLYHETLPRVLAVLVNQNPRVSESRLLEAAIEVLDEELIQILSVLRIWTDAFGQVRSGNYKQLDAVVFSVRQAFHLQEMLKTSKYAVGNVFVARFSDQGPATLPGTRGPIGAHAIEVPHDERNIISLMLVLYMHEFRHDIFADVDGLADELTMAVARSISESITSGAVKLSKDKVQIGKASVRMADLMVKFFADTIGEVDADISGGILLSGPAYLYNMLSTFSAFNSRREGVFNNEKLLRTSSYFGYREMSNGQRTIEFWPHPPDYIRAYIVAAALDVIGFHKEARQCRLLADQAVGTIPTEIVWKDENPKRRTTIRIPVEDIKTMAPVVARALMDTPLESMGGATTRQVINWTEHRQSKVDKLTRILMSGRSDMPTDSGDMYATYVAAAATLAYWGLVRAGISPRRAAASVDRNALEMIETLRERFKTMTPPANLPAVPMGIAPVEPAAEPVTEPAAEPTAKPAGVQSFVPEDPDLVPGDDPEEDDDQ